MNPANKQATGEPSNNPPIVTLNTDDDAILESFDFIAVPISRPLPHLLHINQLNDDCLLALFDQFPFQHQLPLRAVCQQWAAIIEQKFYRKRTLKLFKCAIDVGYYCDDLLNLKLHDDDKWKLKPIGHDDDLIGTLDQLHKVSHLFANIENFVCYDIYGHPNLDLIPAMFPRLTSLTLHTYSSPFRIPNSLPQLTSFHLHFLPANTVIPEKIPIFQQLESFSLIYYSGPHLSSLFALLGPNLRHLMLSNMTFSSAQLASAFDSNPSLAISITHLTLGNIFPNDPDARAFIDFVCSRMVNLTYLQIDNANLQFLPSLAKLHHLTELHLNQFTVSLKIPFPLPSVKFVKNLCLSFAYIPSTALNLHAIFPAIETITIYAEDDIKLLHSREYLAQFPLTFPVSFHKQNGYRFYMGRH